jgi:methionyl-tRNA formyltransferase
MVIYHFCNDTFGIPFPPVSAAFAKTQKVKIVRVLSVKPEPLSLRSLARAARRPAGRALRRAKRLLAGDPAHGEDLPTLYVTDVNAPDFTRLIKKGDAGVITGFNQIFRAQTIARFSSFANLHPSILPLYRGPVPTYWQLRNDEQLTGFTLHKVTPQIDSGEPLYQEVVAIDGETDLFALALKVGRAATPMFRRYLEHLISGDEWVVRHVDAYKVYKTHLNYASFPDVRVKPRPR